MTVEATVPFHDCDPLGVVWHGRYFEYLELARTALLRSVSLDAWDVRDLGLKMFITEARCRYLYPLSYGEVARITAFFSRREPVLRIAYEVENVTKGRRSARGHTDLATTDQSGVLCLELPDALASRLPPF